jgi:autotransporter-associated beta strand protein
VSFNNRLTSVFVITIFTALSTISLSAQTETWTGGTSATWNDATNWNSTAGAVPVSGATALFNGAGGGHTTIIFSAAGAANSITFDTSSAAAYTIGSTADTALGLTLDSGGTIQTTLTVANVETINEPLTLEGNYTFTSGATTAADVLDIGGTITNGATATPITLNLNGSNTGTNTISGNISNGSGTSTVAISKSGTGTWVLNGTNTDSGGTSITGGTLDFAAQAAWNTNAGNTLTVNGGTFQYKGATALSVNQAISIGTTATFDGSGTTQSGSALTIGSSTTNSIGFVSGLSSGSTITLTGTYANGEATSDILNDIIADNGGFSTSLVKSGAGNWQLNGVSTYSGSTSISGGVLSVGVTNALPTTTAVMMTSGTLNLVSGATQTITSLTGSSGTTIEDTNGGNGTTTGVLTVNQTAMTTFSGTLSQRSSQLSRTLAFAKSGSGTLTLSGANTYAGSTSITGGTLSITNAKGLGFGVAGNVESSVANNVNFTTVSGGTLDLNGSSSAIVVDELITLNGGNLVNNSSANTTTLDNGVGAVVVTNAGSGGGVTAASVTFSAAPSGGTTASGAVGLSGSVINSFTYSGAGSGYTTAPTITITPTAGGPFTTAPVATALLSSLTLTGTSNNIGGTGNLVINAVMSGTGGGFAKTGTGMVTLNGANTYTGTTTVSVGSLLYGIQSGGSTVGSSNTTGAVSVAGGATLGTVAGNATNTTLFTNAPSLTLNLGTTGTQSNLQLNLYASGVSDTIDAGVLTLSGSGTVLVTLDDTTGGNLGTSPDTLMTWTSGTYTTSDFSLAGSALGEGSLSVVGDALEFTPQAVPEPSTWALMLAGLGALAFSQRRKLGLARV